MPRLYSYMYSEGPGASSGTACPATAPFAIANTLGVIEQASPGTTTRARTVAPTRFDDALATWETSINLPAPAGSPSGIYAITYDSVTKRVTIATSNSVAFRPFLPGSVGPYLGFTTALTGWQTSWTADSAPLGATELLGATVKPSQDAARITLEEFRHGRSAAISFGNLATFEVRVWLNRAIGGGLSPWVTTGRVRVQQGDGGSYDSPWSTTNLGGYVDGYVVQTSDLKGFGPTEEWLAFDLLIAVAR